MIVDAGKAEEAAGVQRCRAERAVVCKSKFATEVGVLRVVKAIIIQHAQRLYQFKEAYTLQEHV